MKVKFFVLFLFVTLGTLSAIAQASSNTNLLRVNECTGKKYSVEYADTLSSPYREEANWRELVRANPGFLTLGRIIGSNQTATILPGDVICIPEGTVVADFIKNGDYVPTLVPYKPRPPVVVTLGPGTPYYENWYEDPKKLAVIFIVATLMLVGGIWIHTHRRRKPI